MEDKIRESVEKLFNEPFEPLWMKRKRQAELETEQELLNAWRKRFKEYADAQWKLEAERSHQLIMKHCNGIYHTA